MNNLIMKATPLTNEEYQNIMKITMSFAGYILLCLVCSLAAATICYILDKKMERPNYWNNSFFCRYNFNNIIYRVSYTSRIYILNYNKE